MDRGVRGDKVDVGWDEPCLENAADLAERREEGRDLQMAVLFLRQPQIQYPTSTDTVLGVCARTRRCP